MPKLSEFKGEGGNYLRSGWYRAKVKAYRTFENGGPDKPGVEFVVEDGKGASSKASFWLYGKGPKRLAWFAEVCGLKDTDMASYEIGQERSHKILVGRDVIVRVDLEKPGSKFHEVKEWLHSDDPLPVTLPTAPVAAGVASDDIPF